MVADQPSVSKRQRKKKVLTKITNWTSHFLLHQTTTQEGNARPFMPVPQCQLLWCLYSTYISKS